MPLNHTSIYDACAGRLTAERFLPSPSRTSIRSTLTTTSRVPITPQEGLLGKQGAPILTEDVDWYSAHRKLPDQGRDIIPDGDLLEALHGYVSDFYEHLIEGDGSVDVDWESLDETALMALGVLVEESVREGLGGQGHTVFVEGRSVKAHNGEDGEEDDTSEDDAARRFPLDGSGVERRGVDGEDHELHERLPRRPKKRSETLESRKKRKKRQKMEHVGGLAEDSGDV